MEYKDDKFHITDLEQTILQVVHDATKDLPRPFGLVLSGGFDSGLLAAITKPDFVFSIRFPYGPRYDESRYADAVIDHLGLRSKTTIIEFKEEHFQENLKEALGIIGEPVPHFSIAPFNLLMKVAGQRMKDMGVEPNVLSGEGPDEYLGGYARQIIFQELFDLYKIPELYGYHPTIDKAIGDQNLVVKYGRMMGYPDDKVIEYAAQFGVGQLPLQGAIGKMDMECGVIEKFEQALAKAHGVNLLYPYINEGFAEYCYKLPDHLKVRDGVTKWAFREVCKKYLPSFLNDRIKMGGPVAPVNHWIDGGLEKGEFNKEAYLELQKKILNEN